MKVTQQTTANECGICVINSLIEHYFHTDKKYELVNAIDGSYQNGLSITQFEKLCVDNHLIPYSYELTFEEFKHLDTKGQYFVLLISKNKLNHYVIAKKVKGEIILYDSEDGIYSITYKNLKQCFLGIYIKVEKQQHRIKKFNPKWSISSINTQCLLINVLIELLIGGLSIGFGYFINLVLGLCTSELVIKNLVLVCFMFLVISGMRNLASYVYGFYVNKIVLQNYKVVKVNIINHLMNKQSDFLDKVNSQNLYLLNMAIVHILNFNIHEYSEFIANFLVALVCLIICCVYSWLYIIVMALIVLVEIIFYFLSSNKVKELINLYIKSENEVNHSCSTYINSQRDLLNSKEYQLLEKNLSTSFEKNVVAEVNQDLTKQGLSSLKTFFSDFFYILSTFLGMILIDRKSLSDIGSLLFLISLISLFANNVTGAFTMGYQYKMYKSMYEIYQSFDIVGNIDNPSKTCFNEIDEIYIKRNNNKKRVLRPGKTSLLNNYILTQTILNKIKNDDYQVYLNDVLTNTINQKWLNEKTFYIDRDHKLPGEITYETLKDNPQIKKIIGKAEILPGFWSQSTFIFNLIYHLSLKDSLIIIDHRWKRLPAGEKQFLEQQIFPILEQNNYLIK